MNIRILLVVVALLASACTTASEPDRPVTNTIAPGDGPVVDPPVGSGLVVAQPGQRDPRPIAAQAFTAAVDGRHVVIAIDYTSGVEPCYVLDSVLVEPTDDGFQLTLMEGHGPGDVACIEIAVEKRTLVDLGELEPGTYAISDGAGGAAPISVVVD
jgi:hypothetical protein